jgi:LuxR family transcriptional regulator, maltose regulon positive regulatory protein
VVSVVAHPGYGKTTLLSQWAEQDGPAFAWVSVSEADNDPKVLPSHVAEALDAVEPIDERVFDALASPASVAELHQRTGGWPGCTPISRRST